ncbi:TetR/AcrR family transcriptional regulator [Novosphingobium sp. FKTRR1]|uniref:TetR/AcrR family transcriptional regulator n=1 Tax=Novosphingobium sp. FKTRR1 TaxID=2879118 RepID=UPI001CF0801B|nr:TetR/AcrR family transcriptional regulator [Novosphingobium sp. FKTRR1]
MPESTLETALRPQRDAQRTRTAILAAAQDAFSTRGYTDTGVREITAAAGVNPALVSRYFGSKERLYEAALSELLDTKQVIGLPRESFGMAVVDLLTDSQRSRRNPLPMMMLASADPTARAITDRLLKELFLEPLAHWYGQERGEGKATCFAALASGLTLYRELYPLNAFGVQMSAETRAWLVAAFQSLID